MMRQQGGGGAARERAVVGKGEDYNKGAIPCWFGVQHAVATAVRYTDLAFALFARRHDNSGGGARNGRRGGAGLSPT